MEDRGLTEFGRRIEAMREKCDHQLSEWVPEKGLAGLPTGYESSVCCNCGKVVGRRKIGDEKAAEKKSVIEKALEGYIRKKRR